jgi:hypothetical protein
MIHIYLKYNKLNEYCHNSIYIESMYTFLLHNLYIHIYIYHLSLYHLSVYHPSLYHLSTYHLSIYLSSIYLPIYYISSLLLLLFIIIWGKSPFKGYMSSPHICKSIFKQKKKSTSKFQRSQRIT